MKFKNAETTINFDVLRLTSKTWEMGVRRMIYGFRVSANKLGDNCYTVDYCAASNTSFLWELFQVVLDILEALPDDMEPSVVESLLPTYQIKPINLDPCWQQLKDLRTVLVNESEKLRQLKIKQTQEKISIR